MAIKKVVLIEPRSSGAHTFNFTNMPLSGLPILGRILEGMGLKVRIYCENISPIDWKEVASADLVGVTALTTLAPRAYQITKGVKEISSQILVVMGGSHVTFLPEEALSNSVDFVIRHEGEETFKELIEYLQGEGSKDLSEILGLSFWDKDEVRNNPDRPYIKDINQIPFPDFSLIDGADRIKTIPLETSRGCPNKCDFCAVIGMFGRRIRYRNPESVVEEMGRIVPGPHIFITDDNHSANSGRARTLHEAIAMADLKRGWSVQEEIGKAKDKEDLSVMRRGGCTNVYCGIESFNPAVLAEWHKKQTPEEIVEAVAIFHSHKLAIHGMIILGGDADSVATINHTIAEVTRCGIDTAQFFVLVPAPGTRVFQRLKEENRIFSKDWSQYDGLHTVFIPAQMSPWELQELVIKAFREFYNADRADEWLKKGNQENALIAIAGMEVTNSWLEQNKEYLEELKTLS